MDWLLERILLKNDESAIIFNGEKTQYDELYKNICEWRDIIYFSRIPQGAVISVEGENSPWTLSAMLALIENKNIIVPISLNGNSNIDKVIDIAKVQYRLNMSDGNNTFSPTNENSTNKYYEELRNTNSSGLVLFSSGTTGTPKATVLNFDNILNKHKKSNKSLIIMSFLSFDHIGGINTILYTIAAGGLVVIPKSRSANDVLNDIENWKVEVLPTTPTFINMLLMSGYFDKYNLSSIKLISYGTEPMPKSTLIKISSLLPEVKFKQTYGLSEVGILSTRSKSNNELWIKIGGDGFKYKVKSNILWIKSDTNMLGYINAESPFDDDGYFNTQDIVEFDENKEYIKILGRQSEIINIAGEKVYPAEIENTILEVNGVADVSVIGVKNPVTGMGIKAFIKPNAKIDTNILRRQILNHCKNKLSRYKVPMSMDIIHSDLHSSRFKKIRNINRDVHYA